MELKIALIISVVLQFMAFFITISLIPKTKFSIAWISISIGFLLMALRRLLEMIYFYSDTATVHTSSLNSWIAVVISVTMLVASVFIRKIFVVLNNIHLIRKKNEIKLLSAVISTEEKQRKSFSKELHDGLGPLLSSAKLTISAIDKKNINTQNSELINKVETMVDSAILTTKEISNQLTPHMLERYGLQKAIETFIHNTTANENIEIKISSNIKKQRYKHNIEVILYRICCELINNTLKYASANRMDIQLTEQDGELELSYKDDGKGCEIESDETSGMGLINIKSRVKSLNGSIELDSFPGKGFSAQIKLPV